MLTATDMWIRTESGSTEMRDAPGPVEQRLHHARLLGAKLPDGRDVAVLPRLVEGAKRPALPVGQNVVLAPEALRGAVLARPVPRRLGLGVVPVLALRRQHDG